ncbi:hypothetical protein ACFCX4_09015 [Kitasatospora sp. NPDC056327]|uniref:hypothetical protein n=1 Tax=Kitasatospora sp. NPDC056327 TaxID=3345785 RepID=UPI0035E26ADD
MTTQLAAVADGTALTRGGFDSLVCCDQPMTVAHADTRLPVAGATCATCLCVIVSADYGPARISRCTRHRA